MATRTRRQILITAVSTAVVACAGSPPTMDETTDATDATDTTDTEPSGDTGEPATCDATGADIEGPFWVPGVPVRDDLDVHGEEGPRLSFSGTVRDAATCAPLPGAVVEIWHADGAGDYDEAADGRYRGQTAADGDGAYAFRTIVPGRYLNGATFRPSHIHAKVWVGGQLRLTTQLYLANDPYNDGDAWFDADRIVADLDDGDVLEGTFDFVV